MSDSLAHTVDLPRFGLRSLTDLLVGESTRASTESSGVPLRRPPALAAPTRRATPGPQSPSRTEPRRIHRDLRRG